HERVFTKEKLCRHRDPENLGITLDVDVNNRVKSSRDRSPADVAGIRPGDIITSADSTSVLTAADLQYALDRVPEEGTVTLRIRRSDLKSRPYKLALTKGWRRSDIRWRQSQEAIGPTIGFGGE